MTKTSRSVIASLGLGLIVPAAAVAQQQQGQQQKDQQQRGQQQPASPEGRPQPGKEQHEQRQAAQETIPIDQVPEPARKAIESWAKGSKIDKVEKVTPKDGKTHFKAHIDRDGQKLEVLVTPDGKVLRSGEDAGER